jgi:m7GpppX diphosphatase
MKVSTTSRVDCRIELHSQQRHADPVARSVTLLGTLKPTASGISDATEAKPAIVRIERTALPSFSDGLISTTKLIETTDIVSSLSTQLLNSFL